MKNSDLRVGKWREHLAQEPAAVGESSESELVHNFGESPIVNWKKFLQLIVRMLSSQYSSAGIKLVGPHVSSDYGDSSTFTIKGGLRFKTGLPLKLVKKYGKRPLFFSALIADGQLVEPISVSVE